MKHERERCDGFACRVLSEYHAYKRERQSVQNHHAHFYFAFFKISAWDLREPEACTFP